jgi:hypothetical protein
MVPRVKRGIFISVMQSTITAATLYPIIAHSSAWWAWAVTPTLLAAGTGIVVWSKALWPPENDPPRT